MSRFCPKCGKSIENGAFCRDCRPIDFEFKELEFKFCTNCSRFFHENKWKEAGSINEAAEKVAEKNVKAKVSVEADIDLDRKDRFVKVDYQGETFELPVKVEKTLCPRCMPKHSEYFEGVLQVRNPNVEVLGFIDKEIVSERKRGKDVQITKKKQGRGWVDLFISDQKYIQHLGNKLHKKFGGVLKVNPQLFSRDNQTSRNLYRVNVLVEIPEFSAGDVIEFNGRVAKVAGMGKQVGFYDYSKGKSSSIDFSRIKNYKVLKKFKTTVSQTHPNLEVIHPETFQSALVENEPGKDYKAGEKVKVVIAGKSLYVVE